MHLGSMPNRTYTDPDVLGLHDRVNRRVGAPRHDHVVADDGLLERRGAELLLLPRDGTAFLADVV